MKDSKSRRVGGRVTPAPAARAELPLRKKILFSLVTVVGLLLLLEAAARLFVEVAPNARWNAHKQLVDTVGLPALNDVLTPDPILFWTVAPNVDRKVISGRVARSGEISFTVSTDERGARRVPEVRGARHHVVCLGDSTTFGVGVDDDLAFPAQLQRKVAGVQCVNLGVPGYTAYQGHLRVQAFPFTAPPAVVIIDFGFNDDAAWDNLGDREHERRLWAQRSWITRTSRLLGVLGGLLRRPSAESDAPSQERRPRLTNDEFAAEIRWLAAWCRERRAEPILVVWPLRAQLGRDELLPKQRVLLQVAGEDKIRIANLVPVFRAFGGPAAFVDVVHASAAGNAIVADMLEPLVKDALGGR